MTGQQQMTISALIANGVRINTPESIEIGEEVRPERISGGVTLHAGCRIYGKHTWISKGVELGYEAPATVENCHLGPGVSLGGGFFKESVFLKNAAVGSAAQVREGTILEEFAKAAHCVGLKQTILFPYVTLGSLINFCDCLMTGGTSAKNHSEVGSSYIHFNFTPQQDKATASLIGNVPDGVMLDQSPIFLGGQGGLVGPCRLAHGTVTAAGTICRKDELRKNRLIFEGTSRSGSVAYTAGGYRNIKRIFTNNVIYIANLTALGQWYAHIRKLFISDDLPIELYDGLCRQLRCAASERIRRLDGFVQNFAGALKAADQQARDTELIGNWPQLKGYLENPDLFPGEEKRRDQFVKIVEMKIEKEGMDYVRTIQQLEAASRHIGTAWLKSIVESVIGQAQEALPSVIMQPEK